MQTATEKKDAVCIYNVHTRENALVSFIVDKGKKEFGLMILFRISWGREWGRRGPILKVKRMRHTQRFFLSLCIILFFLLRKYARNFFSLLVPVAGGAAVGAVLGDLTEKKKNMRNDFFWQICLSPVYLRAVPERRAVRLRRGSVGAVGAGLAGTVLL